MNKQLVLGLTFLFIGWFLFSLDPSITGAFIGTGSTETIFWLSLPFAALGAAIIANSLRNIFLHAH
jgi:hypothetical protein